ncbi:MAG: GNAT family N-acetyltransferase [Armatimonadota bacterium]|nr:GNAT family N-acetyltransferase [Armatimonadota bacterium]MDR7563959.1 GNAT family N-acetyltransferase [Armatimonadota bacterium]MDR7568670.1 GNAT family N-acetyltransferase [Armatimonadota bacterium]MDR7602207.1 GNAT family N-acetyltransferase [Armatimonadota bacterium]
MDEGGVSVRPASLQDRAVVAEILTSGFLEKFTRIFGSDPHRIARILADLPSSGRVFVAEVGGRVVGTLTLVLESASPSPLWPVLRRHLPFFRALWALVLLVLMGSATPDPDTALIEAVAVLPQARGRGVGRALMRRALAEAWRVGKRRAALYVVEGNLPALRLYESLGFRAERRVPLLVGRFLFGAPRLLYMARELDL